MDRLLITSRFIFMKDKLKDAKLLLTNIDSRPFEALPTIASWLQSFLLQLPHLSQTLKNWRKFELCCELGFGLECVTDMIYPDHQNFLHIRNKTASLSYHSCAHRSGTFNFLQELVLCNHSVANWCQRPSFHAILAFTMPSSLNLMISSFDWKWNVWLFLSLEHLEATV